MKVALVTVVVFLGLSAPAQAKLVPQRGMAGVDLSMSQTQVRGVLGKPLAVLRRRNEFGPFTEYRYPFLLRIVFQGNERVTAVETRGRKERTPRGAGVGSSRLELTRAVPALRCEGGRGGHCYLGAFLPGRRVTDFSLRDGRVTRVVVGFVID